MRTKRVKNLRNILAPPLKIEEVDYFGYQPFQASKKSPYSKDGLKMKKRLDKLEKIK
jgi:hypothetical protein